MEKNIVTITGIRPDFIRMSEIFKKLDENFNHILIHTGQHFDKNLSDVFFDELSIRQPDYNLNIGGKNNQHYHQTADLSVKVIELFKKEKINPDIVLFLGDSNSVVTSLVLKKEGYKIGHIEAGMRSGDKRMLEEINRIVCDHCSDFLFVYHDNYKNKLLKENINKNNIYNVGNTIVEVIKKHKFDYEKKNNLILLDIHRPENFKDKKRLENIIKYAIKLSNIYNLPLFMLNFKRTIDNLNDFGIKTDDIKIVDLMGYKKYIETVYNSKFIISDSGTAQEEPALLNTKVLVPRDFTERPESIENNCSLMFNVNQFENLEIEKIINWINSNEKIETNWLGDGKTSSKIIDILKEII